MILITGDKGFIGRTLVNELGKKHEVIGLDRKDGDVFEQLAKINWDDIEMIYHQGAISNTTELDVGSIYYHNIRFSIELMEIAIDKEIPIHYASSGSVYGNSKDYSYNPLNYYAMSKQTVDLWVNENKHRFKKPVVGFRYFNVYGNNELKDDYCTSPIYRFSEHAKTHGVIKIFSGSQNTYRDFVCVEDLVEIITGEHESGTYDLGPSSPVSFLEVAEMVAEKYDALVKFIPFPEVIKGKYQLYTKARPHINYRYMSVADWLDQN